MNVSGEVCSLSPLSRLFRRDHLFTEDQKEVLNRSGIVLEHLTEESVAAIADISFDVTELSADELIEFLIVSNALYRGGLSIISDDDYDFRFRAELELRDPDHTFLQQVEPEAGFTGKTVDLPARMLSTDKAYSKDKIVQWVARIEKACRETGADFAGILFRATGKLDGFAAYDDGERLYTRGDGRKGTDITRVFDRGLAVADDNKRGLGPGEIVVRQSYFDEHLSTYFENSRNVQSSVIKEYELEDYVKKAIADKATVFYPFAVLPDWTGTWAELESNFDSIVKDVRASVEAYGVDGVVFEITDEHVKEYMGATNHHWRWQIALKQNTQFAQTKLISVTPQTSRYGRMTPVVIVEPVKLSGVTVQRATAHHYGMVKAKGLGPGAVVQITRSGEVIPYIMGVITPVEPAIPDRCPSCGSRDLVWERGASDAEGTENFLRCTNSFECPAQAMNAMRHFFRTLGNIDGFGPASIKKIYFSGVRNVAGIYGMSAENFQSIGFGAKESENLVKQLERSRSERIDDWAFLAAFGVYGLGVANCEKLLSHFRLEDLFNLTEQDIVKIHGFARKTAGVIVAGFKKIKDSFDKIYGLGFTLSRTPLAGENGGAAVTSPIAGMLIVFTGAMTQGNRDDMKKQAKALGAKVGSSVSGKTNLLVTGENVGATKMSAARSLGVKVVSESEYLDMVSVVQHI
jgi:DNA ligase (NAD+)